MKPLVRAVHEFSRKIHGSLRMQSELADNGVVLGRDHISRLRHGMGLKCIQEKKFKAATNSSHVLPGAPNLLEQDFSVMEPGTVFGTDITCIPTVAANSAPGARKQCSRVVCRGMSISKKIIQNDSVHY